MAGGQRHCVIVTKKGRVLTCGDFKNGQLGRPYEVFDYGPKEIENLRNVRQVACGQHHTIALVKLKGDLKLYAWGWNKDGQCGDNPSSTGDVINFPIEIQFSIAIEKGKSLQIEINGNARTAAALISLGLPFFLSFSTYSSQITQSADRMFRIFILFTEFVSCQVGTYQITTLWLSMPGGCPNSNPAGAHSIYRKYTPHIEFQTESTSYHNIPMFLCLQLGAILKCGWRHSALKLASGELFLWGDNKLGQQGQPVNIPNEPFPKRIKNLSADEAVNDFGLGLGHTVVILKSGMVVAWGDNSFGTCGIGHTNTPVSFPLKICTGIRRLSIRVFAGYKQSFAITV